MAQRYGGKFSPDGGPNNATPPPSNPFEGKKPSRAGGRVNFLFLLPFPFLISAFRADPAGLLMNLGAFGLLLLAAWLTRDGVLAQDTYDDRKVAKRPAIPRKIFGSLLTGAGLAVAGLADGSLVNAAIFGLLGTILHFGAFGPDPLKDKGVAGSDRHQSERVAKAVDRAEEQLDRMTRSIKELSDRKLEARVDRFVTTARKMFRTVEQDPRDLTAARKFLGVYLQGASDATVKFVDLFSRTKDPKARSDYEALLDDLETNFAAKTEKLLLDDRTDLNVEIDVLRERLALEKN